MSADGDSDREVEAIMQAEMRVSGSGSGSERHGSPVASYGSLGASLGSSRAESCLIDCGSSGGRGDRPPSSYGSMKSDDAPDDDLDDPQDFKPPPSLVVTVSSRRLQIHRAESPETTFTEATNALTCKSTIPKEGLHVNETSCERSSEMIEEDEEEEEQKAVEARGGEEEDMESGGARTPPPEPPQPPAEGLGLQFGPVHKELSMPFVFKSLLGVLSKLSAMELTWFKRSIAGRNKENTETVMECDVLDIVDYLIEHFGLGGGIKLAASELHSIDRGKYAENLEDICRRVLIRHELQEIHMRHYEVAHEAMVRPGEKVPLKRVFTEPVLVEGGHRGVNTEHEILCDLKPAYGEPRRTFHLNDILRESLTESGGVRIAVLSGPPMVGLTYAAHKLVIDWSQEEANQDLHFFFYITCQDLRKYVEEKMSLVRLLKMFHHPLNDITPLLTSPDTPSVLLLEGWEESRPVLNMNAPPITDITQEAPFSHLLASIIRGDLLPHVRLIITCRRSDLALVPLSYVDRLLEMRGFSAANRDDYFLKHHKREPDVIGPQVLAQLKRSPTLYAAAHLPVFAWIVAFIFERNLERKPSFVTRPPHETVMLLDMLLVMVSRWQERYRGSSYEHSRWTDQDKSMLMRLGRFALKLTEARRTCFHSDDLKEHELDLPELLRLGMFTEELPDWTQGMGVGRGVAVGVNGAKPTYVFVHVYMQEFMAAFYVYLTFRHEGRNVFEQQLKSVVMAKLVKDRPILDLLRPVLDRALASPDRHMDLLLRFLCGLALDNTEEHLRGNMLPHHNPPALGMDDAQRHIRKRMETASPRQCSNLERCLNEMKELVEDTRVYRGGF